MATSFGSPFVMAAFLKLIHDVCELVSPLILERIILFLEDPIADPRKGIAFVLLLVITSLLQSITLQHYFYLCSRTGRCFRTSCVTLM